jgi:CRP-like cAMP-binding protein
MNDICRSMSLESYSIGDVVFNQGDIGDKVYVLLSGSCEVRVKYKIDLTQGQSEIREKLIVTYHSGQFFGERALQFDEPRSGTVVCTSFTDLVTITKATYVAVLNDARKEAAATPSKDQLGTKESVINILSKIREKRTNQELDAVAAYLWRRIPFFQKFTTEQLVELCRVAETVSIWGRSMLFKQGQSGQAFYVILTGTVEVWVQSDNSAASNVAKVHVKPNDLTEGLGNKVNQLVSGDVFGERALENDTSQRMASIVTCEDKTELLVIAKEDYHNLVYVMMHIDSMSRLSLLRKTELFRSVDVVHLKVLARFMEPRKYNRDEPLFIAGRKAIEMIIIEKGECRAETIIREGYEKVTA